MRENLSSPIKTVATAAQVHDHLILQGGEPSGHNPSGGIGWMLSMDTDMGKITIAGVGDGTSLLLQKRH